MRTHFARISPLLSLQLRFQNFPSLPQESSSFPARYRIPRTPHCSVSSLTMASSADPFNEFDDSFLDNVDVDALVAKQQNKPTTPNVDAKRQKKAVSSRVSNGDHKDALLSTLHKYFGYTNFRSGQIEVMEHVMNKRDVAVFWATGSGKSLCYQIPALCHAKNTAASTAIVISPLISLMQDQVHKLNGLMANGETELAIFLGSAQTDALAEDRALRGEFALVYVTPERLLSGNLLNRLAALHRKKDISLFAIDEAHCVSEWGFDFRPEFRNVGRALRTHSVLSNVPILALTATAVPRVQHDICDSLQMRNPVACKQTFDRSNLKISVHKKTSGGVASAMSGLLKQLTISTTSSSTTSKQSTIVYAPTRSSVEEVAMYLQSNAPLVRVQAYHAGLPVKDRSEAHTNFLTGITTVIVATVAFGMGIDKPDTRRVIHYGCPKTLEEYYQQIGRAGRDGLQAECTMHVSEADFDKYKNNFFLGGLSGKAKAATEASMAALRSYSLNTGICRRKALLDYFQEIPAFGDRCGTCDTCISIATHGADSERDFAPLGARIVLQAVQSLKPQGISTLMKVVSGSTVEEYRYQTGYKAEVVQKEIVESRKNLAKKYPPTYYKDLIAPLTQSGFLSESTQSTKQGGYDRSWTTYSLSTKGMNSLRGSLPVILPVSETVRQLEREDEERRQKVLASLAKNGIPRDKLPKQEVDTGDGEVIRAYSKWYTYLENLGNAGRVERVAQLKSLVELIEQWRSETAIKQRMSPSSVLAEHTLIAIAYTVASLKAGVHMEQGALEAAGVRTKQIGLLVERLADWVYQAQPSVETEISMDSQIILTEIRPTKWAHAVYKPQKKTGKAVWESSYDRFKQGESLQAIAMTQADGKAPIQVNTVAGHIMEAIVQGRSVENPQPLLNVFPAPSESEWDALQKAEAETMINVADNPATSGPNGAKFLMGDFLRPIVGSRLVDTPFAERSLSDKEEFSAWCNRLRWYMTLRRAGISPTFR